jgi:RNA-directed DNA polymerase
MTPGVDGETFDGISLEKIDALVSRVMEGTYEPTPVRRVYIPKANGKKRPLGIPTASDRLVQEALRSILDVIYEPIFSIRSHGFRSGRSCHSALEDIKRWWNGTKWFVEVDIVGYFDNIDHRVLMDLLAKRIDDKRFLRLVHAFLQAGYLEDWRYGSTYSGTPQGGIISPLLANIYLHELDEFMEKWIEARNTGKKRKRHPDYNSLTQKAWKLKAQLRRLTAADNLPDDADRRRIVAELKAEITQLKNRSFDFPEGDPFDPNFRRYRYVRYADDFLIGVIGSKADAQEAMDAVREFLCGLKLEVSEAKSNIRHGSDGVIFLGYDVHTWTADRYNVITDSNGRTYRRRQPSNLITLNIPRERLVKFCNEHHYGDLQTMRPASRGAMLRSSEYEIVAQTNAEFRGFCQYYSLASNRKLLGRLSMLVVGSVLKTIAAKNHSSVREVSKQMRPSDGERYATSTDIHGKTRTIRLWKVKDLEKPNRYDALIDRTAGYFLPQARNDVVDILFVRQCLNCGSKQPPFEIHHTRRLADHAKSPFMDYIKAARSRKRIPLCQACHLDLHAGRLSDYRHRAKHEMESRVR